MAGLDRLHQGRELKGQFEQLVRQISGE